MNPNKFNRPLPHRSDTRRDPFTQLCVEQALASQRWRGTRSAAEELAANGVSLDIARRVLAMPGRRRARQRGREPI